MPRIAALAALLLTLFAAASGARAETPVDLELVLAVDVSGSMDPEEHAVQRNGYVAALAHPDVVAAIRGGVIGRIAVTYVEWAGPGLHSVTVPWRLVDGAESARAFAAELAAQPIAQIRGTSISAGLGFASGLFDGNGVEGTRRVIDVSGDGPNNMGPPVETVRDAVLALGIVVNGLPVIIRPSPGVALDQYYRDCVIGGPGAFVLPVDHPEQMAEAIRRKLILEIAATAPGPVVPAAASTGIGRTDCLIGERRRMMWDP